EGGTSGYLYVLIEGRLEVLKGETVVASIAEPGAIVGEMSVLLDKPHTATVRAASDSTIYEFADAGSFLRDQPAVALLIARLLAQRLNVATTYRLCKNATFMVGQPPAVGPRGPVSCADRFHQSANAQNAHHPLHVVGQDVQRHFGTDVLERLHLEVRRSHPRLYRAEGVLDSLAAYAHLIWIPIEPGLH